jgi:TRAP-type C4-dicarboxylate transport system substrate-binding protein
MQAPGPSAGPVGRRSVLAGASLLGASAKFGASRAAEPEFAYKFGNSLPDTHPLNQRLAEAAAAILRESGGRLDIKLFPNSQLGGDTDMLSQVRSGALEFISTAGLILSTLVPVAAINGVGFAFPDYASVWGARDGELGLHVRAAIAKLNLQPFDRVWDNGFRQITSSTRPINRPRDLEGFKIRVPVSPLYTSLFRSLGAGPGRHQSRRGLFRPADACRRRAGKPARGVRDGEAV